MNATFHAISREAAVAAEHLANGATILGKANYANHAHYEQAFFALSTGIERSTKLIFVIDHALDNAGTFPTSKQLRAYGHDLRSLLDQADAIAERRGLAADSRLPRTPIHDGIITVLTDFANNVTRYYNFDLISGDARASQRNDPTKEWFQNVVRPVLAAHYDNRTRERHRRNAQMVSSLLEDVASVHHFSEDGQPLDTMYSASLQTGTTEFAKPYVRMYVMQIARFLGKVLSELAYGSYEAKLDTVPHLSEFFALFYNDDKYFFRRKTWSIYRP
jgi:hypothetical protein